MQAERGAAFAQARQLRARLREGCALAAGQQLRDVGSGAGQLALQAAEVEQQAGIVDAEAARGRLRVFRGGSTVGRRETRRCSLTRAWSKGLTM